MHDFIALGDVVTDAFIRLSDPRIHAEARDDKYELCLPFAEKVPFDDVYVVPAVGNAGNAAVSAAKLGLKTALVSNLGDDKNGEECLEALRDAGVETEFIRIQSGRTTNYHYVLWFKDDRTILVKHEDFSYGLPEIGTPKWLYFSSISGSAYPFHDKIAEYLENHPEINLAFQPGKFEIKLGLEKLQRLYKRANILFVNVEEAETILGMNTLGIEELIKRLQAAGPKIVVITDGTKGSHTYDGTNLYFQPPYPDPKPPYERTGAGDAFASTTVAALALEKTPTEALEWGAVNAMSVVQEIGAQKGLLTRPQIEKYLNNAPAEFQTKKLN